MRVRLVFALVLSFVLSACVALVAPYDSTFDQSLNKLSEDTARFLGMVSAGGSERRFESREATEYYSVTYNVLDRLKERARLTRAVVPCPNNASLGEYAAKPSSRTVLPPDQMSFDCREFQLYAVRFNVDQLRYLHESGGTLNASEAKAAGGALQVSILGSIETFLATKPAS